MEKLRCSKEKNSQFDRVNNFHRKIEKVLASCEEFKDWEEHYLLKDKLMGALILLNKLRIDIIKDSI